MSPNANDDFSAGDAIDDTTFWSEIANAPGIPNVPDIVQNLGDNAKKLLKDPRTYIIGVIVQWFVGGILGFIETVFGLILSAFAQVAGIPGMIASGFGAAGGVIEGGFLATFGALTEMAVGLITGFGWAGPLVAALVLVALLEASETVGPPVLNAFSDLLGAVPVVGSVLDALLTFLIGVLTRLGGDGS